MGYMGLPARLLIYHVIFGIVDSQFMMPSFFFPKTTCSFAGNVVSDGETVTGHQGIPHRCTGGKLVCLECPDKCKEGDRIYAVGQQMPTMVPCYACRCSQYGHPKCLNACQQRRRLQLARIIMAQRQRAAQKLRNKTTRNPRTRHVVTTQPTHTTKQPAYRARTRQRIALPKPRPINNLERHNSQMRDMSRAIAAASMLAMASRGGTLAQGSNGDSPTTRDRIEIEGREIKHDKGGPVMFPIFHTNTAMGVFPQAGRPMPPPVTWQMTTTRSPVRKTVHNNLNVLRQARKLYTAISRSQGLSLVAKTNMGNVIRGLMARVARAERVNSARRYGSTRSKALVTTTTHRPTVTMTTRMKSTDSRTRNAILDIVSVIITTLGQHRQTNSSIRVSVSADGNSTGYGSIVVRGNGSLSLISPNETVSTHEFINGTTVLTAPALDGKQEAVLALIQALRLYQAAYITTTTTTPPITTTTLSTTTTLRLEPAEILERQRAAIFAYIKTLGGGKASAKEMAALLQGLNSRVGVRAKRSAVARAPLAFANNVLDIT